MVTRIYSILFLSFLYCASVQPLLAYNLKQISNKDGLSNSAILSICQDSKGFMWFGSCDGLNKYNGVNVRVYKPSDEKNNLSGNLIYGILEAQDDTFWITTNYGLNKFDYKKDSITHYNKYPGELIMTKDNNNRLFLSKDGQSIHYYHKQIDDFKQIKLKELIDCEIIKLTIDATNTLWVFSNDGKFRSYSITETSDGNLLLKYANTITHKKSIQYCYFEENSAYLIDNDNVLFEFDFIEKKLFYIYNLNQTIEKKGEISSIIKYHNDFIIGFDTNGLILLKNIPELKENYKQEDINVKSGVFCLHKDRNQDIVWIGTDCQGVYIYYNDPYLIRQTTFNSISFNVEKPIRSLLLDKENTLWIGTKGDGLLKLTDYDFNKTTTHETTEHKHSGNSQLSNNSVYALAKSQRNILWIGNEAGVDYYSYKERKIKKVIIDEPSDQLKYIHGIYEMNDTILFLASVGSGIFKARVSEFEESIKLSKIEHLVIKDGSRFNNFFFTIYSKNISTLLFGNRGNGIIKVDAQSLKYQKISLGSEENQLLNDVFCITSDEFDNTWCGTSLGLVKLSPNKKIDIYNDSHGFPNSTIHGLLNDSQGNIWLSTNQGIIKFNTQSSTFQTYNQFNGLKITEFSDGAFYKDESDKILFFGGINGFVAVKEAHQSYEQYMPKISIDNLIILGETRNLYDYLSNDLEKNILHLNYKQNFFSLSFKVNDYLNGNNYSYYYKLDGVNENWINNGNSSIISFTNLNYGNYKLLIKYKNSVTETESPPFNLQIRISPPWYHSNIAYIFCFIIFLASIKLIVNYYISKSNERRNLLIERLNQKHKEDRYESKLLFFTNIAHEFCTPLTLIEGPCDQILSYEKSDQFIKKHTHLIKQNASRLTDLIQDLVEFRRIETGNRIPHIENICLNEILNSITDSFTGIIESKNINCIHNISSTIYWNTDVKFIKIILSNLISNAFKYVNINGIIKINITKNSDLLTIEIENTGKGIEENDIKYIFDRYRILNNFENQGNANISIRNGLGMAITYNLVQLLNGTIEVTSIPDQSTIFSVILPMGVIKPDTSSQNITEIINSPLIKEFKTIPNATLSQNVLPVYELFDSKQTVLIIDDNPEILWFIGDIFSQQYNVITSNNPTEVELLLSQNQPDIILCDIMMPDLDGIALTKNIKMNKNTAHIPMILISAKHNVEEKIKGLSAGAEMFITKPFNVDFLKASVERLILHKETLKTYFSSPISAFVINDGKMEHKEDKSFIQNMISIINNNLTNNELSVKFIASELNVSIRYLYRKLEKLDVDSPNKIIRNSKLYVAENLLIKTKLTIDEIIYKSGFSNRSSFFKAFQEKYNCTPKVYRENNFKEITELEQKAN